MQAVGQTGRTGQAGTADKRNCYRSFILSEVNALTSVILSTANALTSVILSEVSEANVVEGSTRKWH